MSVSSDGIIAYGIHFDEEQIENLPWLGDDGDTDIEDWWIDVVHGYKPPFEIFNKDGDYIGGVKPPQSRIDEYFNHRRSFTDALPKLPVEMVIHCSYECPMYIMAIPETKMEVWRGYPKPIPDGFIHRNPEWDNILIGFCKKYGIEMPDKPAWWLTSLYG